MNEQYLHNFSVIHRYSIMQHLHDMKDCRVSGHQMGYIIYIKKNPGASQEDIVEFFKLNKGTVAKGIRKLLDEGFIIRKQNEYDRRAYQLYLTNTGEKLFAESKQTIINFNKILTNGMTDDEQATFRMLLQKATENIIEAAGDYRDELLHPGPPPGIEKCCFDNPNDDNNI